MPRPSYPRRTDIPPALAFSRGATRLARRPRARARTCRLGVGVPAPSRGDSVPSTAGSSETIRRMRQQCVSARSVRCWLSSRCRTTTTTTMTTTARRQMRVVRKNRRRPRSRARSARARLRVALLPTESRAAARRRASSPNPRRVWRGTPSATATRERRTGRSRETEVVGNLRFTRRTQRRDATHRTSCVRFGNGTP